MFEKFKQFEISKEEADQVRGGQFCFNVVSGPNEGVKVCRGTEASCENARSNIQEITSACKEE